MKLRDVWMVLVGIGVHTSTLAQAPSSDIFLGQIERTDSGPKIVNLKAITNNDSYSNQPYFFNENTLYYTQQAEQSGNAQMDIMRYDIEADVTLNVTNSDESEYSATPTPDGSGFSVIKVTADGLQQLWKFSFEGMPMQHLVPQIEPIGYHSWTRDDKLLLFVLGDPPQLVYANPAEPESSGVEIAKRIGASIFEMPMTYGISYSVEGINGDNSLFWFEPSSGANKRIGYLPKEAKYYAWSPRAELFTTDQGKLVAMPFIINGKELIYTSYSQVSIESEHCQQGISRIAISPYDEQIALVCER